MVAVVAMGDVAAREVEEVEVAGVVAEGMVIRDAQNYALAAFIKKPQFGPSSMKVTGLTIEGSGLGDALAQTGCVLEIDGVVVPTQDLDVGRLYREKVLGQ